MEVVFMLMSLFGCKKKDITEPKEIEVIDGGSVNNSDPNAPKHIDSKDIVKLDVSFYAYVNDEGSSLHSGIYHFVIEDGMLSENFSLECSSSIDSSLLKDVQAIIEKYDLVTRNGFDKHSIGVPVEYEPCFFTAEYESGEKLYFSETNDPCAEWARALLDLFAGILSCNG